MRGFRVYDTVEKKYWIDGEVEVFLSQRGQLVFYNDSCNKTWIDGSPRYIVEKGATVEGKQFFVGDVCEDDPDEPKLEIGWCDITAKFTITQDNVEYSFDNYNGDDLKVVGTIHDNPDMEV